MITVNVRSPMCRLCGSAGKIKGGVKSESNPRLFYERYFVCSNPRCANADKPQSMHAFEGVPRAFGERF